MKYQSTDSQQDYSSPVVEGLSTATIISNSSEIPAVEMSKAILFFLFFPFEKPLDNTDTYSDLLPNPGKALPHTLRLISTMKPET